MASPQISQNHQTDELYTKQDVMQLFDHFRNSFGCQVSMNVVGGTVEQV